MFSLFLETVIIQWPVWTFDWHTVFKHTQNNNDGTRRFQAHTKQQNYPMNQQTWISPTEVNFSQFMPIHITPFCFSHVSASICWRLCSKWSKTIKKNREPSNLLTRIFCKEKIKFEDQQRLNFLEYTCFSFKVSKYKWVLSGILPVSAYQLSASRLRQEKNTSKKIKAHTHMHTSSAGFLRFQARSQCHKLAWAGWAVPR